jgi:hypothetical protein
MTLTHGKLQQWQRVTNDMIRLNNDPYNGYMERLSHIFGPLSNVHVKFVHHFSSARLNAFAGQKAH